MDLTVGDYLALLEDDADVERLRVLRRGLQAARRPRYLDVVAGITAAGRTVVLYRAGRTSGRGEGARQPHRLDRRRLRGDARSWPGRRDRVADSLEDFDDLVSAVHAAPRRAGHGRRLGALSNAGFECVAIADNLGALTLPAFSAARRRRSREIFERARISALVDVHNPLDVTPMLDDAGYEAVVRRMLDDDNIDVGVVGCVPLTAALNTLAAAPGHGEDLLREGSIAQRLLQVKDETHKPWIAIVDAGAIYDPLAEYLQEGGIPTFRTADRALRLLNTFVAERFKHTVRAQMERWVDEFSQPEALAE